MTNHRQSSLKQERSHIVYWMWFAVVSKIISHIIQFEATFCKTSKGIHIVDWTWLQLVTNPYNPYRSYIWKTWNHKLHYDLNNVAFYDLHNPEYLLLWLQSGLCGLCGLFRSHIIWIKVILNPHFITRDCLVLYFKRAAVK